LQYRDCLRPIPKNPFAVIILSGLLLSIFLEIVNASIFIPIFGIVLSVLGLEIGSDYFVEQSISAGSKFKIPEKYVGTLILSIGASIDELFLSLTAAVEKFGEISVGNIQGSNIFTFLMFVILAPFVLRKVKGKFSTETVILITIYIAFSLLAFVAVPSFYVGIALLAVFVLYVFKIRSHNETTLPQKPSIITFSWLFLALGIILLFLSSYELVRVVNILSGYLHLSLFASGFIFAGLVGSIPEIFIFSSALRKKKGDIGAGVVYGSTIYKVTLVLGLSMTVTTVAMRPALLTYFLMIGLLALGTLVLIVFQEKGKSAIS